METLISLGLTLKPNSLSGVVAYTAIRTSRQRQEGPDFETSQGYTVGGWGGIPTFLHVIVLVCG